MSETLSNVLNKDFVLSIVTPQYKNTTQSIPIFPAAGSVTNLTYAGAQIVGRNADGNQIWIAVPGAVNASAVNFHANIARINDNTGWVLASNSVAAPSTTLYIGILNFTTGAITSSATLAANPTTNSAFDLAAVSYLYGLNSRTYTFRKLPNGNLSLTRAGYSSYFEFTTAGALVVDSNASSLLYGTCFTEDESCSARALNQSSSAQNLLYFTGYDKYGQNRLSNNILVTKSMLPTTGNIWAFGNYAIIPEASGSGFSFIFLKTEIDKLIKRAVLESGGRLS
jgi:hypothetical protein